VLYGRGTVGPAVDGFATTYYDKTPSPLSPLGGGTASLFGPGGLVQSATEITNDLDNQNYLAAGLKAINAGTILKNTNLTTIAAGSLAALGRNIISGNNPLNTVFVPNSGNLAGTPAFGLPTVNSPIATGGITTNGSAVGGALAAAGLSIGALAAPTGAAGVAITAAITTGVLRKASSLGKLTTIDKSGAVTGTTNLPTQTDAEQALANAESNYPTAATAEENQQAVLDAYNQDQAAAAQSAADAAAAENTDTQSGQLNQDAGVSQDQNYA
jgi:hypothetical protein